MSQLNYMTMTNPKDKTPLTNKESSIHDEALDEDEDRDWIQANIFRRTLLDKVVGKAFGNSKQKLYKMFPKLAVITVPKMPIITPKGDEIIHRNKFKTQLDLLKEAYNMKMQLYEEEQEEAKTRQELPIPEIKEQSEDEESSSQSSTPTKKD